MFSTRTKIGQEGELTYVFVMCGGEKAAAVDAVLREAKRGNEMYV